MPDFLDRFGDQLHAAQPPSPSAVADVAAASGARLRIGRRGLLAAAAILAVAAPVSIAVVDWSPDLERAGIDKPVTEDTSPVALGAVNAFTVLHRAQTAADRASAEPLIKAIGAGNQIEGVQTHAIRMVAAGWALVPAKTIRTGPQTTGNDQLCLTDGQTVACTSATSATTNGLTRVSASVKGTQLTGIVPDGVTRVRFVPQDGTAVEERVKDNFFQLDTPETRTSPSVRGPNGVMAEEGQLPTAGDVTWFDADGNAVGPAMQPIP